MRQALMPGGDTSLARVTCSPLRRTVAVMPLIVMCSDRPSIPMLVASMPIESRTRKAVSPARSIKVPKRNRTSSASASGAFCPDMVLAASRQTVCRPSTAAVSLRTRSTSAASVFRSWP